MKTNSKKNEKKQSRGTIVLIVALCLGCLIFDFFEFKILTGDARNRWLNESIGMIFGICAVALVLSRMKMRLFSRPYFGVSFFVCLLVAVNNFPFISYFNGNTSPLKPTCFWDVLLFAVHCISVGVLEECIFRGLIFACLAETFPKNRNGLIKTFFLSSIIFGFSHLLNLFAGAGIGETLLQVGYSVLTGGLFAFAFIKTKNILCPAFLHAVYNFCGLLLSKKGLGSGVVFDVPTVILTAAIAVLAGVYVLYELFHIKEGERSVLYKRLGVEKR